MKKDAKMVQIDASKKSIRIMGEKMAGGDIDKYKDKNMYIALVKFLTGNYSNKFS